jgi:hypothetical protein
MFCGVQGIEGRAKTTHKQDCQKPLSRTASPYGMEEVMQEEMDVKDFLFSLAYM